MSIQDVSPGRFVVQKFAADPLGGKPQRWCKRVQGRQAAEQQEKTFEAEANEWTARQRLIGQAQAKGVALALPSMPTSANGFANFLEKIYLPWARTNLDPQTMRARAPSVMILAQDLGNMPLHQIENAVDELVARWRAEGCRYSAAIDRLGRPLNRKPRPISDAGINERLKILRAILGHAYMQAKVLATRPRIQLLKNKRANPGAAEPIRYFAPEERVRFHRYARTDMRDVFEVGRMLGTRPGELFHLRVGSVDFKQEKIWVQATPCPLCPGNTWTPKTGCFRGIDICPDLMPILRRLTKGKPDDALLIENTHGAPYSRLVGSGGQFTKTLRRAGLDRKGLSMYSLRHTFAADLITAGRPIREVAALLGNTPRTCELHYAHLMPGRTAEAVKALKAIEPWPTAKPVAIADNTKRAKNTAATKAPKNIKAA
jgi:integrase